MTTEEVFHILDILKENGTLGIYFTGGEIFVRPDFEEIYLYAKNCGFTITLLSNITLLTEKHIALLEQYPVSEVSTTLYGVTEQTYEAVTGVKGSYQRFITALQRLKQHHISVSLKYVVVKENAHEVHLAQKFADTYSCKIMTSFAIHVASDGDAFPLDHRVSPEEAFQFDLQDSKRNQFWKQKAKELYLEQIGEKEPHTYDRRDDGYLYPCDITWHSTFISHTGRMQACAKASYQSYDLLHGDFQTGWDFLHSAFREKKPEKSYACLSCDKFHYCEQCTANFMSESADFPMIDSFFCQVAALRKAFVEKESNQFAMQQRGGN